MLGSFLFPRLFNQPSFLMAVAEKGVDSSFLPVLRFVGLKSLDSGLADMLLTGLGHESMTAGGVSFN